MEMIEYCTEGGGETTTTTTRTATSIDSLKSDRQLLKQREARVERTKASKRQPQANSGQEIEDKR